MKYTNANHKVGSENNMSKVASLYDSLMQSNRQREEKVEISSFSDSHNELLRDLIQKEAQRINDDEMTKTASQAIDKVAFFAGGLDMFTKTRQLISKKLGVSEDVAHNLTSPVLSQADNIVNSYGGDASVVVEGIVQEMGPALLQENNGLGKGIDVVSMRPTGTKDSLEHIKNRMINELGLSSFEAERYKHAIWKEARDLATMLRPHDKYRISNAIINLMVDLKDPEIVYGLKDSPSHIEAVRSYLS